MPIGCLLMGVAKVLDKLDIIVADNNDIQQDFEFIKDKLENE